MSDEPPASDCPLCGSSQHVRAKLIATNFPVQGYYAEQFTVEMPMRFRESPHTLGDYFVSGLFCDHCDSGFLPDEVAETIGIVPDLYRKYMSPDFQPFGVDYIRSDVDIDGPGTGRPFNAIIWKREPDSVGVRVTIHAVDVSEAARILEREHGTDVLHTLWNDKDAERPR